MKYDLNLNTFLLSIFFLKENRFKETILLIKNGKSRI
jgi:hypothetical protein